MILEFCGLFKGFLLGGYETQESNMLVTDRVARSKVGECGRHLCYSAGLRRGSSRLVVPLVLPGDDGSLRSQLVLCAILRHAL